VTHCRQRWVQHLDKVKDKRNSKKRLQYKPRRRRDFGRPRKRWSFWSRRKPLV